MKKYDYHWQRAATTITGIIFTTQLLSEVVSNRKPGYEWVLPASGILFTLAIIWSIYTIIVNAAQKRYTKTTAIQPITSTLDQSFMDALAHDEHLDCNAKTSKPTMLFSCFKCKEQITALDSCGAGSTWHLYECNRCQQLHITGNPPKEAISEETVLVQL